MSLLVALITNSSLNPSQPIETVVSSQKNVAKRKTRAGMPLLPYGYPARLFENLQTASPRICNKMSQKGYAALKNISSFGAGALKGAVSYGTFQALYDQIFRGMPYNLKVFSAAVFKPSDFRSNRPLLKETLDKIKHLPNLGMINSDAILEAACPYQEYLNQMNLLLGENYTPESIAKLKFLYVVLIPAVAEELIFRGLLQDVVLKRLVGKIVQKIAPSHAGLVDSKIYTAIRIALTTYAFSSLHEVNRATTRDSYIDMQLTETIIMGIGFGILKEAKGLSWAIGAHAINNLSAALPDIMMKC